MFKDSLLQYKNMPFFTIHINVDMAYFIKKRSILLTEERIYTYVPALVRLIKVSKQKLVRATHSLCSIHPG